MLQALKGRNVVLFPDLNAYEKWAAFALYFIFFYFLRDEYLEFFLQHQNYVHSKNFLYFVIL